jgi:hypothetical protein
VFDKSVFDKSQPQPTTPTPTPTTPTTVFSSRITIIEKSPVGGTVVYIIKDAQSGREFLLATGPERGTSLVEIGKK